MEGNRAQFDSTPQKAQENNAKPQAEQLLAQPRFSREGLTPECKPRRALPPHRRSWFKLRVVLRELKLDLELTPEGRYPQIWSTEVLVWFLAHRDGSSSNASSLVFRKWLVRISTWAPTKLTEVVPGFSQFLQENIAIIPQTDHCCFLPDPLQFIKLYLYVIYGLFNDGVCNSYCCVQCRVIGWLVNWKELRTEPS